MPRQFSVGAWATGLGLLMALQSAQAGTVTVLTSLSKELTTAYQKAFEAKSPGIKVEILNKNTTAAIAYVRELAEGQRPDVMWVSAPDAFEVLARNKLLQAAHDTRDLPATRLCDRRPTRACDTHGRSTAPDAARHHRANQGAGGGAGRGVV